MCWLPVMPALAASHLGPCAMECDCIQQHDWPGGLLSCCALRTGAGALGPCGSPDIEFRRPGPRPCSLASAPLCFAPAHCLVFSALPGWLCLQTLLSALPCGLMQDSVGRRPLKPCQVSAFPWEPAPLHGQTFPEMCISPTPPRQVSWIACFLY